MSPPAGVWARRGSGDVSFGVALGSTAETLWRSGFDAGHLGSVARSVQALLAVADPRAARASLERHLAVSAVADAARGVRVLGTEFAVDAPSAALGNGLVLATGLLRHDGAHDGEALLDCVVVAGVLAEAQAQGAGLASFVRAVAVAATVGRWFSAAAVEATGLPAPRLAVSSGACGAAVAATLLTGGDAAGATRALGLMGSCIPEPVPAADRDAVDLLGSQARDAVLASRWVCAGLTVNRDALDSGRGVLRVLGGGAGRLSGPFLFPPPGEPTRWKLRPGEDSRPCWPADAPTLDLVHASVPPT